MKSQIFKEGRRLYKMGLAIHWLHPKQKRPIENGWTTGPRKDWGYLAETYIDGLNLGVRTGSPSKLKNGFLACIDVDIKVPQLKADALLKLKEILGKYKITEFPQVQSGAGNGSCHLYCVTKSPFKMLTVAKTKEWEICIYSNGRQMVLPPSIHPNGSIYRWVKHLDGPLPLMDFSGLEEAEPIKEMLVKHPKEKVDDVEFTKVDLDWLPISDKVREAIVEGTGVDDRSGYLLTATMALHSAGLERDEILSVLTAPETYLGECAYDHAKTNSRRKAASWLWKYTVKKVLSERSGASVFKDMPLPKPRKLSPEEIKKQNADLEDELDWRKGIVRGGKEGMGPPIHTIQNVVLILQNLVASNLVRRNEFAFRDTYSCKTPWGAKKNATVQDDDIPQIAYWLGRHYKFEPSKDIIYSALTVIACQNSYDPVRDWLDELPKWDGKKRLRNWLKNNFEAKGDEEYLAQVFSKWMSAMVRRVYEPGCKFDWMPIFEGFQGTGKSSFGRLLVGDEYFLDWLPNLADKDSALGLQGQWGVEMGELSQFKKNELETIKAFITRTVDKFRPPHGRKLLDSPRRCVFFGTTNKETYLLDDTGNRRFKPVVVGRLDFEALKAQRKQLFAEAKHLYNTKYNTDLAFELTGAARIFEAQIHQEKMIEDESAVMYLAMQDFIEKVKAGNATFSASKFRLLELFSGVAPLAKWPQNARNMMFAAKMLKKFGGEKRQIHGLNYWKIALVDTSDDGGVSHDFY